MRAPCPQADPLGVQLGVRLTRAGRYRAVAHTLRVAEIRCQQTWRTIRQTVDP